MKGKKGEGGSMKAQSASSVRASISFPPDLYATLERGITDLRGFYEQARVTLPESTES